MPCHQRHNLVVSRPCPAVRIIRAKVQAVNGRACLAVRACGIAASRDELPHKGLGGKPLLIVAPRQIPAVALIPIEQGKPHRLPLFCGEGVPSVGRCLCQCVPRFQRHTWLKAERRFPVHIHTVFVFACPSCSMTSNVGTGIIPHGVPCTVVGVGKANRSDVARRKRCRGRDGGQCRDRSQSKRRSPLK